MRKVTLILGIAVFLCLNNLQGQAPDNSAPNFKDIKKQFYLRYQQLEKEGRVEKMEAGEKEDGLIAKFKRWEYLMTSRTFPSGKMPPPGIQFTEWKKFNENPSNFNPNNTQASAWEQVGNSIVPSNGGGAGRINVVKIDPSNSSIIYIGAAGGGVWKTVDDGATWTCLSDKFPVTSISDIAIDPTNSNNIFVATGDEDGYEASWQSDNDFWGGVYTAGVLHSTNGGATWAQSWIKIPQEYKTLIQRLIINPANPNILLAASRNGIYRSNNGGNTWKKVLNNHCHDMEWKPNNPNIVYAGGNGVIYQSTNAGATWSTLKTGLGSGRMALEVSASSPDVIYSLNQTGGFYRSDDNGATWGAKAYPYAASFYGYYDLTFTCSQDDVNVLITGGLYTAKSINGGSSWSTIDIYYTGYPNYVHADKHAAIFYPGSTTSFLLGTDGGIFKTVNGGTSFSDISNGLIISQIYRIGTTPQNTDLYISGWQDNGCNMWNGTSWKQVFGADGMEAAIDYTDQNVVYETYQNGGLQRSLNGGLNWTYIAPVGGGWVTPFIIDPVVNTRLYYSGLAFFTYGIYKSENRGSSWTSVPGISLGSYGTSIAAAPSNNNTLYASSLEKIFKANISLGTAVDITSGLPVAQAGINYIAVNNLNENKLVVALSGYTAGKKVYYSDNGGSTWTNISKNLPNLPVNTVVYQNNTDRIYVGTDVGVYYLNNTTSQWVAYNNKLPNVMVHELEINYTSNKLIAATYGRGIWKVDLVSPSPVTGKQYISKTVEPDKTISKPNIEVSVSPNPSKGIIQVKIENASGKYEVEIVRVNGKSIGLYSLSEADAANYTINLGKPFPGNYLVVVRNGKQLASKEITITR